MELTEQQQAELQKLAEAVAMCLGLGWKGSYHRIYDWKHVARVEKADGAAVHIWVGDEGITTISGDYGPLPCPYGSKVKDIHVQISRGAAVIAAEIQRRLLPLYLPEYEKTVEDDRRGKAFEQARRKASDRLAALVGEEGKEGAIRLYIPWHPKTRLPPKEETWHPDHLSATITVSSEFYGDIDMESVPFDLLVKLAQVIRDYAKKGA